MSVMEIYLEASKFQIIRVNLQMVSKNFRSKRNKMTFKILGAGSWQMNSSLVGSSPKIEAIFTFQRRRARVHSTWLKTRSYWPSRKDALHSVDLSRIRATGRGNTVQRSIQSLEHFSSLHNIYDNIWDSFHVSVALLQQGSTVGAVRSIRGRSGSYQHQCHGTKALPHV